MSPGTSPSIAWIGAATGPDLAWTRRAVEEVAAVRDFSDTAAVLAQPPDAVWPAIALLGSDESSRWTLADLTSISRRWPLTPIVSVAASIVDGRRRSGPALAGAEEVPWSEVPSRLAWWLADRAGGRPGTLGLPVTARREDRVLEATATLRASGSTTRVSVAADRPVDLDGLADLVLASGRDLVRRTCGRPPLDEPADLLVWDTTPLGHAHLAWLGMLTANRPALAVVVVDSFPRAETALLALQAGATAVLDRPVAPESLAGAIHRAERARATGLGLPRDRG